MPRREETVEETRARRAAVAGIVSAFDPVGDMLVRVRTSIRWVVALFAVASLGVGCSLNPQPLPPDTEPGSGETGDGGIDTGSGGHGDASLAADGSTTQTSGDAGLDSAGSIPGEAGPDGDAESDGDDGSVDDAADGGETDALDEGD
jgi:hypothetical protein